MNKLYEQYDEETLNLLKTVDMLKREVIELQAEIATLKAQMRDMI
jgi:uncharacterized small protein (DUF1192 family)